MQRMQRNSMQLPLLIGDPIEIEREEEYLINDYLVPSHAHAFVCAAL